MDNSELNIEKELPTISIITATYNAAVALPKTIQSIRNLNGKSIEWIVIDGGSTDGTVTLLNENEDIVTYWISEPDKGIYDAWNKGVSRARGEWIAFLGAGDSYKPDAIDNYLAAIRSCEFIPDLVSSRIELINDQGQILRVWGDKFDWKTFRRYMNIAHVGALHHRSLFQRYGKFDTNYRSSADYELLMRTKGHISSLFINAITAEMPVGGISSGYKGIYETYLIQKRYGSTLPALFRYIVACIKRFLRYHIKKY